jgi:hypothetical protein
MGQVILRNPDRNLASRNLSFNGQAPFRNLRPGVIFQFQVVEAWQETGKFTSRKNLWFKAGC